MAAKTPSFASLSCDISGLKTSQSELRTHVLSELHVLKQRINEYGVEIQQKLRFQQELNATRQGDTRDAYRRRMEQERDQMVEQHRRELQTVHAQYKVQIEQVSCSVVLVGDDNDDDCTEQSRGMAVRMAYCLVA